MNLTLDIFKHEAKFIAGSNSISNIPKLHIPEIAFIGRSNVGKSSLINKILYQRNLAKVSNTPGRTQQINFFSLQQKIIFVDLPGYGFAKVSLKIKEKWQKLMLAYLANRDNLKIVNLLIDIRRGIGDSDLEMIDFLNSYDVHYQIILTKIDKETKNQKAIEELKNILIKFNIPEVNIIETSSKTNFGIKELRSSLLRAVKSSLSID